MSWDRRLREALCQPAGRGPVTAGEVDRSAVTVSMARPHKLSAVALQPVDAPPAPHLVVTNLTAFRPGLLDRYVKVGPGRDLGVIDNVPPPARLDPVRVDDVLLFPNTGMATALYLAAEPAGVSASLSVRLEEIDDTVRTTGGTLTLACCGLPLRTPEQLETARGPWEAGLAAAGYGTRTWRFLPLNVRSVTATLTLPPTHVLGGPVASTNPDTADVVFVSELTPAGSLAWRQAVEENRTSTLTGAVSLDMSFAAELDGRLATQQQRTTSALPAVIGALPVQLSVVRAEVGVPARLVVRGHSSLDQVALTLRAGSDTTTSSIGPGGGELALTMATTDTASRRIDWSADVSFASSSWPVVRTTGTLSDATGWSQILAPASWVRTIDVMTVLVDATGTTVVSAGDAVLAGTVDYESPAVGTSGIHTAFTAVHQQMAAVVLPDPPGAGPATVTLTMMVLRDGAQALSTTTIGVGVRWVLARVRPDATVQFSTNLSPGSETERDPTTAALRALFRT